MQNNYFETLQHAALNWACLHNDDKSRDKGIPELGR